MTNKEIRRFFTTGKLTESYTTAKKDFQESMSVAEAFEDLDRLYEADEETTKDEAEPKKQMKKLQKMKLSLRRLKQKTLNLLKRFLQNLKTLTTNSLLKF